MKRLRELRCRLFRQFSCNFHKHKTLIAPNETSMILICHRNGKIIRSRFKFNPESPAIEVDDDEIHQIILSLGNGPVE